MHNFKWFLVILNDLAKTLPCLFGERSMNFGEFIMEALSVVLVAPPIFLRSLSRIIVHIG